jgi:hypothetical protein
MTDEEFAARQTLIAKMLIAAPWLNEAQCTALLDGTQEERTLIIQSRATASITEGPEVWQTLLTVLSVAAGIAGSVLGITNAISGVYGTLKAL